MLLRLQDDASVKCGDAFVVSGNDGSHKSLHGHFNRSQIRFVVDLVIGNRYPSFITKAAHDFI